MKTGMHEVPITTIDQKSIGPTDPEQVKGLSDSFEVVPMLNPITVTKDMKVIAGSNRYRAARLAGKTKIAVHVVDLTPRQQEIARIDENIRRKVLTVLELADQLKRRQELYEEDHPETKKGGDPKARSSRLGFAKAAAKEAGVSARTVQQHVQVAKKLSPKAKKAIAKTAAADDLTGLTKLAQLDPEHQVAVAERVAETGESVKQAAKSLKRAEQVKQARVHVTPAGEYPVIAIDPPWAYDDLLDGSDAARGGCPYPSMSIEQIAALELPLAQDAAVFLWVTNSHLIDPEAYAIVAATWKGKYGLEPKGIATWEKDRIGLGRYFRNKTEHLVLLVRGKPVFTEEKPWSHFRAPVGEHSEKPEAAYLAIEKFCASTSRLEMFARAPRVGWVTSGSELANLDSEASRSGAHVLGSMKTEIVPALSENLGDLATWARSRRRPR